MLGGAIGLRRLAGVGAELERGVHRIPGREQLVEHLQTPARAHERGQFPLQRLRAVEREAVRRELRGYGGQEPFLVR